MKAKGKTPKGHQPQHGTHYHTAVNPSPKKTKTAFRNNTAAARGSGQPLMPALPPPPPQALPPNGQPPQPPPQPRAY